MGYRLQVAQGAFIVSVFSKPIAPKTNGIRSNLRDVDDQ